MKKRKKLPTKSWYKAMDLYHARKYSARIESELKDRLNLLSLLGNRVKSFIKWAGKERLCFEANLDEEVKDFLTR